MCPVTGNVIHVIGIDGKNISTAVQSGWLQNRSICKAKYRRRAVKIIGPDSTYKMRRITLESVELFYKIIVTWIDVSVEH